MKRRTRYLTVDRDFSLLSQQKTPELQQSSEASSGGWGIRTPEGLHPTRFPSVRHRPLGESSGA